MPDELRIQEIATVSEQHVLAGWTHLTEGPTQSIEADVEVVAGGPRSVRRPQELDEQFPTDLTTRVQNQVLKQGATLLGAPGRDTFAPDRDLERPQDCDRNLGGRTRRFDLGDDGGRRVQGIRSSGLRFAGELCRPERATEVHQVL